MSTDVGSTETWHVSTVAIGGRAVLIEGASGAGKSDLALRLIDRGAILVSDDYTVLSREGDGLIARPPTTIAGMIEVRGLGIISVPHLPSAPVALLVRLDSEIERMPDVIERSMADVAVPVVALNGVEASSPIKVELALARIAH
jgi:serine kinase of HPr protein (carbohydrate metabolism regulator)